MSAAEQGGHTPRSRPGGLAIGALAALAALVALAPPVTARLDAAQVRTAASLAKTAFVTNRGSDNVAVFIVQPNGVLRGPPRLVLLPDGLRNAAAAVLTPDGEHLFVGSWGSHAIAIFEVDPFGSLTAIGSEPHPPADASNTTGLAITPDGRFLFAASYNDGAEGTVAAFAITDDGSLAPASDPIATQGLGPVGLTLAPDGRHLYVAHMTSGTVSVLEIEDDGQLALRATTPAGEGTFSLHISPSGRQLYALNAFDATISQFAIGSDGTLDTLAPPIASGAVEPRAIVLSPDRKTIYVGHFNGGSGAGSLTRFTIRPDGILHRQGSPVPSGGRGASALAARIDRLYVVNSNQREASGSIASFLIALDGSLSRRDAVIPTGGKTPDWGGLVLWPPAP